MLLTLHASPTARLGEHSRPRLRPLEESDGSLSGGGSAVCSGCGGGGNEIPEGLDSGVSPAAVLDPR